MKLLFRTDASKKIGTGHVMRCLALSVEARRRGWNCCFVLRDPSKSIIDVILGSGSEVRVIITKTSSQVSKLNKLIHSDWLNTSQSNDANESLNFIIDYKPNWIIVDHYAIDSTWATIVKKHVPKILVIDDLGDRNLVCDILLDQNLGASSAKYAGKVPRNCKLLLGPRFALLRSEFREWRESSLEGRKNRNVENILITMGGVDAENYTLQILKEIKKSKYAKKLVLKVITGGAYPHTNSLKEFVNSSGLTVSVAPNVKNMAEIMSKSDLCFGAAGSTSWERCCLGLPTITFAIANNQREIADQLSQRNVAIYSDLSNLKLDFEQFFDMSGKELQRALSTNSSQICDGLGVSRVLAELEKKFEN